MTLLKIAKRIVTATLAVALLCSMPFAEARTQTIEATGVYQMGENDTIATAKENAKKAALRAAAEQAGVYVRSYSKTKNLKLTDDQVEVISIQTMQVKDCTFTQDYTNNTLVIHAAIRATVDDDDFQNFQKCLDEHDKIEALQSQLDAEKAKNQAALNHKMQQSGDDPYAAMLAEQELQKFQQNIQYAAVIRKEFADFVDQRAGVVPADIYGRMALLDLCTGSDLFQRDIDKAMEIAPKDPLYYTISALQALRQEDYYGAEALADQALRLDKHYWPSYYVRAIAKGFRGSTRKAIADCDTALKRGGENHRYVMLYRAKLERIFVGRHNYENFTTPEYQEIVDDAIHGFYRDMDQIKHKNKR